MNQKVFANIQVKLVLPLVGELEMSKSLSCLSFHPSNSSDHFPKKLQNTQITIHSILVEICQTTTHEYKAKTRVASHRIQFQGCMEMEGYGRIY